MHPWKLREQVGFKLCALLNGKLERPGSREYLFGDDVEKDAVAFHLYARLVNGELSPGDSADAMRSEGVRRDDRKCAFTMLETFPGKLGRVERIFINLERNTSPEKFEKYSEIIVPVRGAGQLAFALYDTRLVDAEAVRLVIDAIKAKSRSPEELVELITLDALERGLISKEKLDSAGIELPDTPD